MLRQPVTVACFYCGAPYETSFGKINVMDQRLYRRLSRCPKCEKMQVITLSINAVVNVRRYDGEEEKEGETGS